MKSKFININGAPYGKQVSLWLGDLAGLGGVSTICKEEEICKANSCTCVFVTFKQPGRESNKRH